MKYRSHEFRRYTRSSRVSPTIEEWCPVPTHHGCELQGPSCHLWWWLLGFVMAVLLLLFCVSCWDVPVDCRSSHHPFHCPRHTHPAPRRMTRSTFHPAWADATKIPDGATTTILQGSKKFPPRDGVDTRGVETWMDMDRAQLFGLSDKGLKGLRRST